MCLAIPGQIVEMVDPVNSIAKVDVGGVKRNVNIGLLEEPDERVDIGDWVLIHVDEAEAARTLFALQGMGQAFEDELQQLVESGIE
jgi:hydrogenase expression/formation protein HypC